LSGGVCGDSNRRKTFNVTACRVSSIETLQQRSLSTVESSHAEFVSTSALSGWDGLRGALKRRDVELRPRTIKWLATLPADIRPMRAARAYPRIVNRMGDLWSHCEYTRLHFQSLLIDRRSERQGLRPEVIQEIIALQTYYFENLSGLPAILWNAVPVRARKIPDTIFPPLRTENEIDVQPLPA